MKSNFIASDHFRNRKIKTKPKRNDLNFQKHRRQWRRDHTHTHCVYYKQCAAFSSSPSNGKSTCAQKNYILKCADRGVPYIRRSLHRRPRCTVWRRRDKKKKKKKRYSSNRCCIVIKLHFFFSHESSYTTPISRYEEEGKEVETIRRVVLSV